MDAKNSKKELSSFIKYTLYNCILAVIAILFIYLFYYKIRIDGQPLIKFYNTYFSQTMSVGIEAFFKKLGNGNLILMLVSTVIEIVLFFGIALIAFLVIPVFILSFIREYYIQFVIKRKNCWVNYNYQRETEKNIPHQKRETGDEWYERKQNKQKAKESKASSTYSSAYSQQRQNDSDDFRGNTAGSASTNHNPNEITLEKALNVFLFDNTNYTKAQLKKRRNQLIRTLHPDKEIHDSNATEDAKKINLCYQLLLEYAKED